MFRPSSPRVLPKADRSSLARSAYTLTEVMIVLAILAGIAGLTWPVLMRPWSRSLSQQAAQQLVEQLAEARRRSVQESRVYQLRWRPGTRQFEISAPGAAEELTSNDPTQPAGRSAQTMREAETGRSPEAARPAGPVSDPRSATSTTESADPTAIRPTPPWQLQAELAQGVRFGANDDGLNVAAGVDLTADGASQSFDPRDADSADDQPSLEEDATSASEPQTPWSDPVWFFPDGRTSNAQWTLRSDDGYEVKVVLRGLTGTARVGRVRQAVVDTLGEEAGDDLNQAEPPSQPPAPPEERGATTRAIR